MAETETTELTGEALAIAAARQVASKLAEDVVVIDVRGLSTLTDFLVVCHGTSMPHLRAIRKHVVDELKVAAGTASHSSEGVAASLWMVVDYIDVMVHIFHPDRREHYKLEDLWGEAPRIDWQADEPAA